MLFHVGGPHLLVLLYWSGEDNICLLAVSQEIWFEISATSLCESLAQYVDSKFERPEALGKLFESHT